MRVAALSFCCAVALLGLGVGCSGDGQPASTPTKIRYPVTVGEKHPPKPPPCPTRYNNTPLASLNTGISSERTELVPLTATKVWICQFDFAGHLYGPGGYLSPPNLTGAFVIETNRLPRSSHPAQQRAHPRDKLIASQPFNLIFASDSQQIVLRMDAYGDVTNGYVVAQPTCSWRANFLSISCAAPPSTAA
jgi:hypothetical protein